MSDLIRRQTIKDVMMEEADAYCKDVDNLDYRKFLFVFVANLTDRINLLPSVTPLDRIAKPTTWPADGLTEEEVQEAVEEGKRQIREHDCISRQATIESINKFASDDWDMNKNLTRETAILECLDIIYDLPSVKPERPKGKWKKISPANIYECSECGQNVMTNDIDAYSFCHGCGRRMEN